MGFAEEADEKIKSLGRSISGKVDEITESILVRIPEEKRKPALINAGVTVFLLILVIVIDMAVETKKPAETAEGPLVFIPADALFFPPEPDFVPDYIFERNPKEKWTLEDIRPLWKDPGEGNLDLWQEEMSAVINRLMDTVP